MENSAEKDPRVYFAAERTFLAWIRTGLGLIGVGFAVSRFGLFLREVQASDSHLAPQGRGISGWSGIAIVMLGVIVDISAVASHYRIVHELSAGSWIPGRVSMNAVILAIVLAAAGVGMAIYLVMVH